MAKKPEKKIVSLQNQSSDVNYEDICNDANDLIQCVNAEGNFIYVNKKWVKTLGYTKKEAKKLTFSSIVRKSELPRYNQLFKKLAKAKVIDLVETVFVSKGGKEIIVEGDISSVIKNGKLVCNVGIFRDVTRRKNTERECQTVIESINDVIYSVNRQGVIDFITPNIADYGYTIKDVLGHNFLEFVHPDDKKQVVSDFNKSLKTGKEFPTVFRLEKKDKSYFYVEEIGRVRKEKGKTVGIIGVIRNIAERKKSERIIDIFEKGFDYSPNSMFLVNYVDNKPQIEKVNKSFVNYYGYEIKEVFAKNPSILQSGMQNKAYYKNMWKAILDPKVGYWKDDVINKRKDGSFLSVVINITTIFDKEGKATYFVAHHLDITERGRAKEALKKSEYHYRSLFQNSRDAVMTLEPPSWNFTSGNSAAIKMFAARNENFFTSLPPWKFSPKYQPDGQPSSLKAKKMITKAMKDGSNFFEWTHNRLNGENFPATVLLSRMEVDGKQFLQATVRDITQQKKIEKALQKAHDELERRIAERTAELMESEKKFRNYIDKGPTGIFVTDLKGNYIDVNRNACEMTGYSRRALLNMNIKAITAKESLNKAMEVFDELLLKRQISSELIHVKKDGTKKWWKVDTALLSEDRAITFTTDITEHRKMEETIKLYMKDFESSVNSTMLVDYKNKKPHILRVNKSFENYFDYTSEEVIGKNPRFLKSSEQSKEFYQKMWKAILDPNVGIFKSIIFNKKKNGTLVSAMFSISTIFDIHKKPTHFIGHYVDITEHKKMEEIMQLYMKGFDSSPNSMVLADYKNKKVHVLHVNKSFTRFYGYELGEVIGKQPNVLKSGIQDKQYYKKMYTALLDPKIGYWQDEIVNKRKDGTLINVILTVSTIFDKNKKPAFFSAHHIDITMRKKAEKETQNAKNKLENKVVDLEKFVNVAVGRELKMIELKKQIKELEKMKNKK